MQATDNAQTIAPTPRRRMRATRYELFARNGHLVLRCHSPDAIGGFYNLDIHREPNAIVLRNMRKRGETLANRYRVEFIDATGACRRRRRRTVPDEDRGRGNWRLPLANCRTIKRDYVRVSPRPDAKTVMRQLPAWIAHYNEVHPHKALAYRSPREFIAAHARP
jgi:transposase InsO family protein